MTEQRITEPFKAELRVKKDGDGPGIIEGHAAVFNSDSRMMVTKTGRRFVERILPGAFRTVLGGSGETKAKIEHDDNRVIARRSKGSLKMSEDDTGLAVEIRAANTSVGRDAVEAVGAGILDRMSFGFTTTAGGDSWERRSDGTYLRTVKEVALLPDVTLTDDKAAYPATDLYLRTVDAAIDKIEGKHDATQTLAVTFNDERLKQFVDSAVVQLRATMSVEDNSLVWCSRSATSYFRYAFDQANSIIDTCAAVKGDLTESDRRAIDDVYGQIVDLIPKLRAAKMALDKIGAKDDDDEEAATASAATTTATADAEPGVAEASMRFMRSRLENGTLNPADAKAFLSQRAKKPA